MQNMTNIEALLDNTIDDITKIRSIINNEIENQQIYGMTMTLNPNKFIIEKGVHMGRIKEYTNEDMELYILKRLATSRVWKMPNLRYQIYKEYTKVGRIHFHAVIKDVYLMNVQRLAKWWRREIGYVKVETELRSKVAWIRYCRKDGALFQEHC